MTASQLDPRSPPTDADLAPTWFLDSDHPAVSTFAHDVTEPFADDAARFGLQTRC